MSMEIGGLDLILAPVSKAAYDARRVLSEVADAWPHGVFQAADEVATTPVAQLLSSGREIVETEFFLYRDPASADDWNEHGATEENGNNMLHFLVRDLSPAHVEVTMVVGDMSPEMAYLYWAIDEALTERVTTGNGVRPTIEAELRTLGSSLAPEDLSQLVTEVRHDLHPEWTKGDFARHPREAAQFCDAVRAKTGLPLPDDLIMRVLLKPGTRSLSQP